MKIIILFYYSITLFVLYMLFYSFKVKAIILFSNTYIKKICNNYNYLFLTIFTSNIIEETMNFYISSIKKFNIKNIIFISLDSKGYNISRKLLPNVIMSNFKQNIKEHIDYNTPLYWKIVYAKTDHVKFFLENYCNVILCDSDIIFLKDPREYILKLNTDLVTSCDHSCPRMNSGF